LALIKSRAHLLALSTPTFKLGPKTRLILKSYCGFGVTLGDGLHVSLVTLYKVRRESVKNCMVTTVIRRYCYYDIVVSRDSRLLCGNSRDL
jgi:hypothetical protein